MLLGPVGLAVESEMVGRPGEGENPVAEAWCCCMEAANACWAAVWSFDFGLDEKKLVMRLPFEVEGRRSPGLTG